MSLKRTITDGCTKNKRSTQTKLQFATNQYVECPICELKLNRSMISIHIESCLSKSDCNNSPRSTTNINVTNSVIEANDMKSTFINISIEKNNNINGIWIIKEFISEDEESALINSIDSDSQQWVHSLFSGHCDTKVYGVSINFRKRYISYPKLPLPDYLDSFPIRLRKISNEFHTLPHVLRNFTPNECNINSYLTSKGHFLRPHVDDRTLSGQILMNLSLGCDATMTYSLHSDNNNREESVLLPRRALQLVTGDARWKYQHGIYPHDIHGDRRISITWREACFLR